jgi:hypothetical protein
LNEGITILSENMSDWHKYLQAVCFSFNVGQQASTGYSPYFLFHGRHAALPLDLLIPKEEKEGSCDEYAEGLFRRMECVYADARNKQREMAKKRKLSLVMITEKEKVKVKGVSRKLLFKNTGPHRVLRQDTSTRYTVSHVDRGKEVQVGVNKMRLYHPFERYDEKEEFDKRPVQPGDLCVIGLSSKTDKNPFYIARVERVGKTVTVQWFGNLQEDLLGMHEPQWVNKGLTYFGKKEHGGKSYTNTITGPILKQKDIQIYGFELNDRSMIGKEVLREISDNEKIRWSLTEVC